MQAAFEITADNKRITDLIRNRFIALEIYDSEHYEQDSFSLTLADFPEAGEDGTLQYIELPRPGVILSCFLGYAGFDPLPAGEWVCTGVETQGGPGGDLMVITGTGVNYLGEQVEKKTRSWNGLTLGLILETIAAEHDLTPKIAPDLAKITVEHIDQTGESDMHFINRLSKDYNAIGEFRADKLIFVKRNQGKNAAGEDFPTEVLEKKDLSQWAMSVPSAKHYSSVEVKYKDFTTGSINSVNRGEGSPVLRMERIQFSKEAAERLADAKLEAMKQEKDILSIRGPVPVHSLLLPETTLNLTDLRPGMDGLWRVQTQRLTLDAGGLVFEAMCARPVE